MEKKEHQPGKKKKSSLLSNLMLLVCVLVFAFAAWKLWGMYQGYHGGEQEYEELRQYVTKKSPEDQDEDKPDAKGKKHKDRCPVKVDFLALKKINPQIVGWLYIPHSEISYPIVQGEDNIYYLNHTFERKENFTGAVFLDSICMPDFGSDNSIVYGHNLKSGEMFGFLKQYYDTNYNENADYKKRQLVWVITPDQELEYKIFSAREISVLRDLDVYTVEFGSEEDFALYLADTMKKSLYDTGVKPKPDRILTLSTCTSSSEDGRFIVQATLIQD